MKSDKSSKADSGSLSLSEEIQQLKDQVEGLRELAEFMPLVSDFRDHMEEEKWKGRNRLLTVTGVFVLLAVVLAATPVYLSWQFNQQLESQVEQQKTLQNQLISSVQSSLDAMARTAAEYQGQLSQGHLMLLKESEARNKAEEATLRARADAKAAEEAARLEREENARLKAGTPVEPTPPEPVPEPPPAPVVEAGGEQVQPEPMKPARQDVTEGELESLLEQVDQAIAEKQHLKNKLIKGTEAPKKSSEDDEEPKG